MKSLASVRSFSGGLAVLVLFSACVLPSTAHAELPSPEPLSVAKVKGWELSLDGRMSAFLSFSYGPPPPAGSPTWQGFEDRPDDEGHAMATRIRSGFVSNYLGWGIRKKVDQHTISGRFALWGNISQQRDKTQSPDVDLREVYLRIDGPWGGVLAGRNMGIFSRGPISLDYDIVHGYGLGSPCMIVNRAPSWGPIAACGHVGFGILFPAFNAQLSYNTPQLAGLQLTVGLFDPSAVKEQSYTRTPLPRVEAELAFKGSKYVHAEVSGSWQRLGNGAQADLNVDSAGVAGSVGLSLGPVQVGATGFAGQGLGIWAALEDYPVFSSDSEHGYLLRRQKGFAGLAALNFGSTKIAGGVGQTMISKVMTDPERFTALNFPAKQLGVSAGVYQGVLENIVIALDFFSANTTWQAGVDDNGAAYTPKQTMSFLNLGATLVY